jgi:PKD repeat protein
MSLTATPAEGSAPLAVTFSTVVNLPRAIARWELAFGDGLLQQGAGKPPAAVAHTYARNGVYNAALIVYLAPPYTGTAIRLITQAQVRVGPTTGELMRLTASPQSGKAPLFVNFRVTLNLPQPVVSWEFVHGDGTARSGQGRPPNFLGKTYGKKGVYRAVLIVYLQPQFQGTVVRLLTYTDVVVT